MISRVGEGLHYLALKELTTLLRGITSKHDDDFYSLICLYLFKTKKKNLNLRKRYVKIKIFVMFITKCDFLMFCVPKTLRF